MQNILFNNFLKIMPLFAEELKAISGNICFKNI